MAYFYGINRGQAQYQATVATTTQTKEVEIQVSSAVTDKQAVLTALEKLTDAIVQNNYPPL